MARNCLTSVPDLYVCISVWKAWNIFPAISSRPSGVSYLQPLPSFWSPKTEREMLQICSHLVLMTATRSRKVSQKRERSGHETIALSSKHYRGQSPIFVVFVCSVLLCLVILSWAGGKLQKLECPNRRRTLILITKWLC